MMQETVRIYNVGDKVWHAAFKSIQVEKPCIVCYGEKQVTVILGNGDRVVTPCDYCGKGFDGATGVMRVYEWTPIAEHIIIRKIEIEVELTEKRQYFSGGFRLNIDDLFDTEAEALVRCDELVEAHRIEEETQAYNLKAHKMKSYSWNVGYHLREARQHRERADYHESRAILCKNKVRRTE